MKVGDQADQHNCNKDKSEQQLIKGQKKKKKMNADINGHTCLLILSKSGRPICAKQNITGVLQNVKGTLID